MAAAVVRLAYFVALASFGPRMRPGAWLGRGTMVDPLLSCRGWGAQWVRSDELPSWMDWAVVQFFLY